MRGHETAMSDVKSLTALKTDSWDRAGLLLSQDAAKTLAADALGLPGWCRKLKADRIIVVDKAGEKFQLKGEFNGSVLRLTPSKQGWRYAAEVAARFLDDEQAVAAGDPQTFNLLRLARRVAASDVTVMLVGPTGTGKEVVSKFLHRASKRAREAFIAVNCAAVPDTMLEALLFGYEKGAFTGAHTPNKGIFRAADGGTLLLDEVSEMAPHLQAKFLRVLQEKEVTPLGGSKSVAIDVRVIATSNRYMMDEVKAGRFREDLYYRLNVFPLATMALSQRPGDILPISISLLAKHTGGFPTIPEMTDEAIDKLESYNWPGNVRELENVLQRALVLSGGTPIEADHLMIDMHEHIANIEDFETNRRRVAAR
ncbi:MAG: sigma-54-dependent Fis family transcriptional regulator [Alphaproteobacteria bacterium]|nr:sigma-54-dependent Fis family transcriptional regulator [Alphaproteobacteria bacterium]